MLSDILPDFNGLTPVLDFERLVDPSLQKPRYIFHKSGFSLVYGVSVKAKDGVLHPP